VKDARFNLVRTPEGFFEVEPKPSEEELRKFYRDQYYDKPRADSQYAYEYTQEELRHKELAAAEIEHILGPGKRSLFEVGFGEGFVLNYFHASGWDIGGIDFSDTAVRKFFPDLLPRLQFGDVYGLLDAELASGKTYDAIVCNNVLEHVLEPDKLLRGMRGLAGDGGVVRIQVPNDGSWLQQDIVRRKLAPLDFWVRVPEHLRYFTRDPLVALMERCGWKILDVLSGFPVDLFLLNPDSAYTLTPSLGRNCHFARVAFELGLWAQSIASVVEFRRACARSGIGRDLIVYATPGSDSGSTNA
jgi:2-polyprenyl-3-methyl-5-hydroxy-6-metoxy-1,4-benzoquinol methylase